MNQPPFSTEIRMVPLSACAAEESPSRATAIMVTKAERRAKEGMVIL